MILAAPLVIPFAEAVGISIATLGMAKAADMVNDYIQENPEESMKILSTIVPNIGIGQIFANKEDSGEDNDSEDVAPEDRTKAERAAEMKKRFKEGKGDKREIGKKAYEEVIKPAKDMEELFKGEERIDGSIEEVGNPKFDFTKFYKNRRRKADGGAIGIEVLFEEKKPRQGLFMGGSPLDGQALAIYNSMNAYGFDDQAIANALQEQGYYTPPGSDTPDTPPTTIQPVGLQTGNDNFSPYNPDPNKIQSFKTDPRIAAANEADVRTKQLTSMGINDPFANEASLSGAYYGDMPEDTSNQIGKQSMFAKAKQGLTGLMDNPITSAIGFAINPAFGAIKGIAKGIGSMIPVNQRAIQENIMGNLGFAVNDIGQIVSTGDYDDESGDNVMAGYNLNRMTVDTFKNRIDKIRNRKIAQTAASRARIKAIEEAQRKFQLAEKLKAEKLAAKAQEEQRAREAATADRARAANPGVYASADRQGFTDGKGGGFGSKSTGTNDAFGNKSGRGRTGYSEGGLVTMFKEKR